MANRRQGSPSQLERLAGRYSAPVSEEAIDRILAIISLAGTSQILAAGINAATINSKTAGEIKWVRWSGPLSTMLGFLTSVIQRRKLITPLARKKMERAAKERLSAARITLRMIDPNSDGALLVHVLKNSEAIRQWTNERIAGEFLPAQYRSIFGKAPAMTRGGEAVRFVRATMRELGITYSEESIIRAMQDAKKPRRRR